jgi:hypothetical protein
MLWPFSSQKLHVRHLVINSLWEIKMQEGVVSYITTFLQIFCENREPIQDLKLGTNGWTHKENMVIFESLSFPQGIL